MDVRFLDLLIRSSTVDRWAPFRPHSGSREVNGQCGIVSPLAYQEQEFAILVLVSFIGNALTHGVA